MPYPAGPDSREVREKGKDLEMMVGTPKFFQKFHGKPLEELETAVREIYPMSQLDFDGGGEIYFHTCLYVAGKPVIIRTGLHERESEKNGENIPLVWSETVELMARWD